MPAFDAEAAASAYAELDAVGLVNIAYLDSSYLPEAKELALRELRKRGIVADEKLIHQVRSEVKFRAQAATEKTYENIERMDGFKRKITDSVLLVGLWAFSLFAPMTLPWNPASISWPMLMLAGAWALFVVDAMRKFGSTGRRRLIYLVVAPAVLCLMGLCVRLVA